MSDFVIVTDSSCDLPLSMVEKYSLKVIPLTVIINGEEYRNLPDESEITCKEFFNRIREDADVSTSASNSTSYMDVMEPLLKEGKDILVLSFSSGLSNTYNSSALAVSDLSEAYPDRKIYAVDTLCAALGQGLIVYLACKLREEGKSIEEVRDYVEANKLKIDHWVTVDDLHQLKKGGRISATTEVVGSVLKIKPIIHVDNEGRLVSVAKARGRKMAIKTLIDKICEKIDGDSPIFISHGDCIEDAESIAAEFKQRLGEDREIVINYIGPVIGAHTGVGVIALFCRVNGR